MGSIGSSMSPSGRMTAASGIARQLATWPSCVRSPSTSWGGTENPGSACERGASRPPGMISTCCLFWMADFMRRPWRLTLTYGKEMARHGELAALTGLRVYFADPHAPWQRGSNENTNGLLRQYLPKGTDLSVFSQAELDAIATRLNSARRLAL